MKTAKKIFFCNWLFLTVPEVYVGKLVGPETN